MLVNLTKVFQGEEKAKQLMLEFDFSNEDISCDATFEQPIKAELELKKGNGETFIKLDVKATAICSCARCLTQFSREFNFSQDFVITPDILTQPDPEIPVSSDNTLDVKQLVYQELSLEIPNALVCSEDCQGLCQYCGKPKKENCGCEDKQIDPRLLVLKQLLQDDDN